MEELGVDFDSVGRKRFIAHTQVKKYVLTSLSLLLFLSFFSCGKKEYVPNKLSKVSVCCVGQDGRPYCPPPENYKDFCVDWLPYIKDKNGRYVFLHGVNVSGSNKFPVNEDPCNFKVNGIPTYVGKPFPLDKADEYFRQIKNLGFNSIRLIISFEGVMPESPDKLDTEYLDYIAKIVEKAWEYDIYVLLDSHTDAVFSRFFISRFNDTESPVVKNIKLALTLGAGLVGGGGLSGVIPIAETIGALVPNPGKNKCMGKDINEPYNNAVRGNMFPKWAVQAILPEREIDSPLWGYPRIIFFLYNFIRKDDNWLKIVRVAEKFDKNIGELLGEKDDKGNYTFRDFILNYLGEGLKNLPVPITGLSDEEIIRKTTDMLPFTNWGVNVITSLDIQRAWAAFFAGKDAYPELKVKNVNIQEYLQSAYERMWREIAKRVKDYPNVLGYDLMNEPSGFFLILTLAAAYLQIGSKEGVVNILNTIFADKQFAEDFVDILTGIGILPPVEEKNREEIKRIWGFDKANLLAILGLNYAFNRNYLLPFHERMGKAIQEEDKDAIIFVEPTVSSIESLLFFVAGANPGETYFDLPYYRPELPQVVYAPHWYADIYPFPGFNSPYRVFKVSEKRRKASEYKNSIYGMISSARKYMGSIPAVLGEFGTYFSLSTTDVIFSGGGYKIKSGESEIDVDNIWQGAVMNARNEDFIIPKIILNDYYEALDELFQSRILWCWSWENNDWRGEGWNSENFSIVEPVPAQNCKGIKSSSCEGDPYIAKIDENTYLVPRAYEIYSRPYPRFLAGKPKHMRFFTKYHYFDPDKGVLNPVGEFVLEYESKETDEPTEIFIPYYIYYPGGFFVWVSDGYVIYDHKNFRLYWYNEADQPGFTHKIIIRGPIITEGKGEPFDDWDYFVKEDVIISRKKK